MIGEQFLPCGFCGEATPHGTLATFGARCKPCFDAYCLERPEPPVNPQGRQKAFQPRRPIASLADEVALPPAVPLPARSAPTPNTATAPRAETNEDPPSWATEQ